MREAVVDPALIDGKQRGAKYAVLTMCIAGGMDLAGLFRNLLKEWPDGPDIHA